MTQYSSVTSSNSRINKSACWLIGGGLILPFLLPESDWLTNSFAIQKLSALIPSAQKLSNIAIFPNVVFTYIVIMLTMSFVFGIGHFFFLESHHDYLQASIDGNQPRGRLNLWFKALLGFFVFSALLMFCYFFPGQPTGESRGSRGQLLVSLMILTKPGLAIFGAIASLGASAAWFCWCLAIYNFFCIPFFKSSKTVTRNIHE